jgi:hypothetical protein
MHYQRTNKIEVKYLSTIPNLSSRFRRKMSFKTKDKTLKINVGEEYEKLEKNVKNSFHNPFL